jgi:polyketide cyclase/dehydrase/lipid transport protein
MMSFGPMVVGIACALGAAGCASAVGGPRAGGVPPASSDQVSSTVSTVIHAPIDDVFQYVVDEGTPARDLRAYGMAPGVRGGVRLTGGGWDHVGARRVVVLDEGATLVEEIERIEAPRRFGYRVSDFSFEMKDLASEGHGYWEFVPTAEGTRVTWTYVFTARACPVEPALRAAVGVFFHPYMERGLASIRRSAEASTLRAATLEVDR